MQRESELAAWLRLSFVPGLGGQGQRKLLSAFGLPPQIFAQPRVALAALVGERLADAVLQHQAEQEIAVALRWCEQSAQRLITLADSEYPRDLLQTSDPPILLYVSGNAGLIDRPALAIVGSRNATAQGRANAENFAAALSDAGLTIISGLALGIDTAAHIGALRGASSTVAVLGTGIDISYPTRNRTLQAEIAERGTLVSEFPLGTPPTPYNFPRRNRIISGLARGVLVVEAAMSSGSLITARQAGEQGRDLYAIPGSIHSPLSRGCHALIKQGAKLVESAQDILEELRWGTSSSAVESSADNTFLPLFEHLGYEPCTVDQICERSGLTPESVSAMLLQLELEGRVASLPGGQYQRIN